MSPYTSIRVRYSGLWVNQAPERRRQGAAILRRVPIASGTVTFKGQDITHVKGETLRNLRRNMQAVFQDPYDSLNPNQSVLEIIAEPLLVHGLIKNIKEARPEVKEFLDLVGMPTDAVDRYPHAFSGGQRQRIGSRWLALALKPEFIVADEPVSALDVSIQAQIVNLMQDLRSELNLTYLFIAHDLSVVRHISDRIAIMYVGQLVETSDRTSVYERPSHPYTQALLSAVPIPDPVVESQRKRMKVVGEVPNLIDPPEGCRFSALGPYVQDRVSCRSARTQRDCPQTRLLVTSLKTSQHFRSQLFGHSGGSSTRRSKGSCFWILRRHGKSNCGRACHVKVLPCLSPGATPSVSKVLPLTLVLQGRSSRIPPSRVRRPVSSRERSMSWVDLTF